MFAECAINVADMVVLTKNQAMMAYKIALAFNLSSDGGRLSKTDHGRRYRFSMAYYCPPASRLVPVIGVVPKVAVAYAGLMPSDRRYTDGVLATKRSAYKHSELYTPKR